MVVALDESQLGFLFYNQKEWISADLFSGNIAYLEKVTMTIAPGMISQYPNGYSETLSLDNSETLEDIAKNQSSTQISTDKLIVRTASGKTLDTKQFKLFYQSLLYTACSGYSSLTDAQKQAHAASGTAGAALVIKLKYVPRVLNEDTGYYEETDEIIEREYCFYEDITAPLQFYTTVNGAGDFYVTTSRIRKVMNDIMKLYDPSNPIKYDSLN